MFRSPRRVPAIKFRKVLIVGLDGLDTRLVESMMAAGELPNLARLRRMGGYAPVATTNPAQTPVAWSTFATGVNPGGHGIFDFLRRDPATYAPDLALNRYEQKNAFSAPRVVNLRGGTPIWERLSRAGIPSVILRCPCTYPPDKLEGRMLAGLGVPDLRGGLGTSTLYTTNANQRAGESEQIVPIEFDAHGHAVTHLIGPRAPKSPDGIRQELRIELDRERRRGILRSPGAAPEALEITADAWSPWLRVRFKPNALTRLHAMGRFRLLSLEPTFELYASPLNYDPAAPLFPISHPPAFAAEIAEDLGPYYTTGMVEDHAGLNNRRIDESAFLQQCDEVWDEREAMMLRELERFDSGLFYCLFDTPDRVQHMFWRFREPDHPANRDLPFHAEFRHIVEDHYRRADAVVGSALNHADDQTLVIALSDHGFTTFRRCVDLNAWLHQHGLLHLRPGFHPGEESGAYLQGIDWSRTHAYALGLGGIYLNLQGREANGLVPSAEADALKHRIASALTGLSDPENGLVAIRSVQPRENVYSGPFLDQAPDLLVNVAESYRASWISSMGSVGADVFTNNTQSWAGDHIIDPVLVPGVLFLNHRFQDGGARLLDLAPTILDAFELPIDSDLEGRSLLR